MNVVIISFEGPGPEWVGAIRIRSLCRALVKRGHATLLVTSEDNAKWDPYPGVEHVVVESPWLLRLLNYCRHGPLPGHSRFPDRNGRTARTGDSLVRMSRRLGSGLEDLLFIPDSRVLWRRAARSAVARVLLGRPCDVLISVGNPVSHIVARDSLRRAGKNIAWIAELQDPWPHRVEQKPAVIRNISQSRETQVMTAPDHLVCVTDGIASMYAHPSKSVIPFGSDATTTFVRKPVVPFTLAYYGNVYGARVEAFRNLLLGIELFNQRLTEIAARPHLEVFSLTAGGRVGGIVHELGMQSAVSFCEPIAREELLESMTTKHLLISIQGFGHGYAIGSKTYDYIMTDRPILGIVPVTGNEARFLMGISGTCVAYEPDQIAEALTRTLLGPVVSWTRQNASLYAADALADMFVDVIKNVSISRRGRLDRTSSAEGVARKGA